MREGGRQIGRDDARHEERQALEAEAVQNKQRLQRVGRLAMGEPRPNVTRPDDPPRDEAESATREEKELGRHERLLSWNFGSRSEGKAKRGLRGLRPSAPLARRGRIRRMTLAW